MFGIWVFTSQGAHGSLVLKCGSSMQCGSWGGGTPMGLARARFGGCWAAITPGLLIDNSCASQHPHPALHPRSPVPGSALGGGWACPTLSSCLTWEGGPRVWHLQNASYVPGSRLELSPPYNLVWWGSVLSPYGWGNRGSGRPSDSPRSTRSVLLLDPHSLLRR